MTADRTAGDRSAADGGAGGPLVHRALGSPVRSRLLGFLRDEPDLDVVGLGERLDLHVNTVRSHLLVLEQAGLVTSVAEQRDRPGRPRLRYRATAAAQGSGDPPAPSPDERAYRFLAAILTSYLAAAIGDSAAGAVDAGEAWGHYVVDRPAPFTRVGAHEAIEQVRELMAAFGFSPEVDATDPTAPQVVLHRCPFDELAREHQDVVCSVHLGLLRGAFDELGAPVAAESLEPWATPQTCVAHLRTAAV